MHLHWWMNEWMNDVVLITKTKTYNSATDTHHDLPAARIIVSTTTPTATLACTNPVDEKSAVPVPVPAALVLLAAAAAVVRREMASHTSPLRGIATLQIAGRAIASTKSRKGEGGGCWSPSSSQCSRLMIAIRMALESEVAAWHWSCRVGTDMCCADWAGNPCACRNCCTEGLCLSMTRGRYACCESGCWYHHAAPCPSCPSVLSLAWCTKGPKLVVSSPLSLLPLLLSRLLLLLLPLLLSLFGYKPRAQDESWRVKS